MIFHDNIPGVQMMKIKDVNDVIEDLLERRVVKEYVEKFEILFETRTFQKNPQTMQMESYNLKQINEIMSQLLEFGKYNLLLKIFTAIITAPD